MNKYQFLDEDETHYLPKRVSLISAPFSRTTSWVGGTEMGPRAIMEASLALESFDDELLCETFRAGFETMPPLDITNRTSKQACDAIYESVAHELSRQRFPVVIGGEHTVTLPAVKACFEKYPDLHVVQFDAHLDLRDRYNDDPLSHACVMRRIHDLGVPFTQIGMRSFSREEWEFVTGHGMTPFLMSVMRENPEQLNRFIENISGPVYITFDVDVLDPSIMPATGTPEPDGFSWAEAVGIMKIIIANNNVIGLDVVELSPVEGAHHAVFCAAKLIYRTLGYILSDTVLE